MLQDKGEPYLLPYVPHSLQVKSSKMYCKVYQHQPIWHKFQKSGTLNKMSHIHYKEERNLSPLLDVLETFSSQTKVRIAGVGVHLRMVYSQSLPFSRPCEVSQQLLDNWTSCGSLKLLGQGCWFLGGLYFVVASLVLITFANSIWLSSMLAFVGGGICGSFIHELNCSMAQQVWTSILSWFGCSWFLPQSIGDLFEAWKFLIGSSKG